MAVPPDFADLRILNKDTPRIPGERLCTPHMEKRDMWCYTGGKQMGLRRDRERHLGGKLHPGGSIGESKKGGQQMNERAKKLLSLLLAVVMVLGTFPAGASAVDEAGPFADVPDSAWYSDEVQYVYNNGLMKGLTSDHFGPDETTTRGMVVTVLHRMEGTPEAGGAGFRDVDPVRWYAKAVLWAQENGIVTGYSDGTFRPNTPMTRQEMVTVFYRYAQYKGFDVSARAELDSFADGDSVMSYAKESMGWAVAVGLITGYTDGSIHPRDYSNRAQLAAVLMRFCTQVVPEKLTVRFDLNYEGSGVYHEAVVYAGQTLAMPYAPSRQGYYFVGWYTDPACENAYDVSAPVVEEFTLYAQWEEVYGAEVREEFFVTYLLNDGSGETYVTITVEADSLLTEPEAPERAGYVFGGWYTEADCIEAYDFSTPVTSDLVLFACWSAPETDADETELLYDSSSGGGTIYSITDIEVADGNVLTTVNVNSLAVLHVEFLSEDDGTLLAEYAGLTPEYCEMTQVPLPMDCALPEYFLVRATLLDLTGAQLCDPYTSIRYTSAYAEFEDRTVQDYIDEGERVLNFSPSIHTNFGVLADGVVEIISDEDTNIARVITVEDTTAEDELFNWYERYVISAPDAQMRNVEPGTVVLIRGADGSDYLFKVGSAAIDENGDLVITPSEDVSMEDFYKALKVDMAILVEDEDPQQAAPQAEIIDVDICPSVSLGGEIDWSPKKNVSVSGKLSGTGQVELKMSYDAKLFGKDYFSCSAVSDLSLELDINVFVTLDNKDTAEKVISGHKLPDVSVPTPIAGLSAFFKVTIPVEWELGGGLTLELVANTRSGFKYDTRNGKQSVDEKSRSVSFGLEGKAELKFGPKVELGLKYLEKVVRLSVGAWAGLNATAEAKLVVEGTDAPSKHACALCLAGTCKWFVEVTATLEFCIIEDVLEAKPIDATLFSLTGWIKFLASSPGEFYMSLINSRDSKFGGKVKFGGGSCPNESYRVTVKSEDENGNPTTGVQVEILDKNGKREKLSTTEFALYLYNGVYNASASINGNRVVKTFVVSDDATEVTLTPNSGNGKLNGKIVNAETNEPVAGAVILVTQGDYTFSTCTADASGTYTASLPAGTYLVEIKMAGYVPFSTYVTVSESQTEYLQTSLLIKNNKQIMGGFAGRITDAVTGNPIDGVELVVRRAWNNPGVGDIIATLETDSNGNYEQPCGSLFGVTIGLPVGNYTVHATKDGYADTDFNIVVLPGVTKGGQDATMSTGLGAEEFRIVLTWGSTPSDLDSHYNGLTTGGYRDHVYYSNKVGSTADLDLDDTSAYGPETITVTDFGGLQNGFVYSVHDFTNRGSSYSTVLAGSSACVDVYHGDELIRTYHVPTGGEGTVWHVFAVNGSGKLIDLNEFGYESTASNVGASFVSTASNLPQTLDISSTAKK